MAGGNGRRKLPASLTSAELRAIQDWERTQPCPEVRRLLWEVFRLRAIAYRADQLERALRSDRASLELNSLHIVVNSLRNELDELPCIQEAEESRNRLLSPGPRKRK